MTEHLEQLMNTALDGRHLLDHPFYRRWESGSLVDGELSAYAEQYRYFETCLPSFLAELAERLPEGTARNAVRDNLADEVGAPSHLELFEEFASHYEAQRASISPAMARLVDAYRDVLSRGPESAMAGLLAYEMQGAEIATTKSEGLREFYGATESATKFWDVHGGIEATHASWTLNGLAELGANDGVVLEAAKVVADAWWEFLTERNELVGA